MSKVQFGVVVILCVLFTTTLPKTPKRATGTNVHPFGGSTDTAPQHIDPTPSLHYDSTFCDIGNIEARKAARHMLVTSVIRAALATPVLNDTDAGQHLKPTPCEKDIVSTTPWTGIVTLPAQSVKSFFDLYCYSRLWGVPTAVHSAPHCLGEKAAARNYLHHIPTTGLVFMHAEDMTWNPERVFGVSPSWCKRVFLTPVPGSTPWQDKATLVLRIRKFERQQQLKCPHRTILPPTLLFPDDCSDPDIDAHIAVLQSNGNHWITKEPDKHTASGIQFVESITDWWESNRNVVCNMKRKRLLLQELVKPILVRNNQKATTNVYVLIVLAGNKWVVLWHLYNTFVSSKPYSHDNMDTMTHVTNIGVQMHAPNHTTHAMTQLPIEFLESFAAHQHVSVQNIYERVSAAMDHQVRTFFLANKQHLKRYCGAYMMTRIDFAIDNHMNFYMLEANNNFGLKNFMSNLSRQADGFMVFKTTGAMWHLYTEAIAIVTKLKKYPLSRRFDEEFLKTNTWADVYRWNIAYDELNDRNSTDRQCP